MPASLLQLTLALLTVGGLLVAAGCGVGLLNLVVGRLMGGAFSRLILAIFGGLLVALGSCIDLVNVVVVLLNATRHVGRYLVKADSTAHTPSAVPLIGLALVTLGLYILVVPLHLVNVRAWVVTYAWFHVGVIFLFPLLVRAVCCVTCVMLARTRIGNHQAHRSCRRRPREVRSEGAMIRRDHGAEGTRGTAGTSPRCSSETADRVDDVRREQYCWCGTELEGEDSSPRSHQVAEVRKVKLLHVTHRLNHRPDSVHVPSCPRARRNSLTKSFAHI